MKIIEILTHSLSNLFPVYSFDDYFKFYDGGWHVTLSNQILKYAKDFDIECWGMEKTITKTLSFEREMIKYKVFPSRYCKFLGEISIQLLKELKRLTKEQKVIIHLHGLFNYTTYIVPLIITNVPIVVQHHGEQPCMQGFYDNFGHNKKKALSYLFLCLLKQERIFERLSSKKINRFFILNENAKTYLSDIVSPKKIEKLSMGVDFELFRKIDKASAIKQLGFNEDKRYILYSGAFIKRKGVDYLIHAFSKVLRDCPDCILVLKGEGNYKNDLEMLTKNLGIGKEVIFVPWVEKSKLPLYFNAADVCVLPSFYEGLGIVGIEALACEVPFIGTNVGGIPEIIESFRAGVTVPPKNAEALTKAILYSLSINRGDFKVDRENARQLYGWENIAKRNIEILDELWEKYYGKKAICSPAF